MFVVLFWAWGRCLICVSGCFKFGGDGRNGSVCGYIASLSFRLFCFIMNAWVDVGWNFCCFSVWFAWLSWVLLLVCLGGFLFVWCFWFVVIWLVLALVLLWGWCLLLLVCLRLIYCGDCCFVFDSCILWSIIWIRCFLIVDWWSWMVVYLYMFCCCVCLVSYVFCWVCVIMFGFLFCVYCRVGCVCNKFSDCVGLAVCCVLVVLLFWVNSVELFVFLGVIGFIKFFGLSVFVVYYLVLDC